MPIVEAYGPSKVEQQGLPSARLTGPAGAMQTPDSEGAGIAEAQAGFGAQVTRAGDVGAGLAIQAHADAINTANQVQGVGAKSDLANGGLKLMNDPQDGALTVHGIDALADGPKRLQAFDDLTGQISSRLTNDTQKLQFAKEAAQQRLSFAATLDEHQTRELDVYHAQRTAAAVDTFHQVAVAHALDPRGIATALANGEQAVNVQADHDGVSPEVRAAQIFAFRSGVHIGVINQLLEADQQNGTRLASAYFEHTQDQINADKVPGIQAALAGVSVQVQAQHQADAIITKLAPAPDDDAAPINYDKLEAAARAAIPDNPEVLKATIANMRERMAAVEAGRKSRADVSNSNVWGQIADGQPQSAVLRLPEVIQDGKLRLQVVDYYRADATRAENLANARESRAFTADQREFAADERTDRELGLASYGRYQELSDPAVLRTLTRGDILKELPTLGRSNTQHLLTDWEQRTKNDASLSRLGIDRDMFKDVGVNAGLTYFNQKAPMTDIQKANFGKLLVTVDKEIGERSVTAGRPLTLDEQRTAMHSIVDRKVLTTRNYFFSDVPSIAALVNPKDRAKAYVPIAQVPAEVDVGYANIIRGTLPASQQTWTTQSIRENYPRQWERAYGLFLAGGTRAEVTAALTGAP